MWWSLADEYDLMRDKAIVDWEWYAELIGKHDPYRHLRSIHNCVPFYDYSRPWVTHCSIQRQDLYRTVENVNEWRERYRKPVVLDEIAYEGNIPHGWGNISGEDFWAEVCAVPQESIPPAGGKDYYLIYYSFMQPAIKTYHIDDETEYRLKVIDTWNMTIEDRGFVKGRFTVELPGRPYMAIQLKKR